MRLWYAAMTHLRQILQNQNLVSIDRSMSKAHTLKVDHRFGSFTVHPQKVDALVREDSYCFGSIRELYIRDCYFRFHTVSPNDLRCVVDLGANRGLFSTMCTPFAHRIIAVEPQHEYQEVYKHNMHINNFKNYKLINAFIGSKSDESNTTISFSDLCANEDFAQIDFLKMDIEGAEFELFNTLPFDRIRRMTIEVHPQSGNPADLITTLHANNFLTTTCDSTFRIVTAPEQIDYIYAQRN